MKRIHTKRFGSSTDTRPPPSVGMCLPASCYTTRPPSLSHAPSLSVVHGGARSAVPGWVMAAMAIPIVASRRRRPRTTALSPRTRQGNELESHGPMEREYLTGPALQKKRKKGPYQKAPKKDHQKAPTHIPNLSPVSMFEVLASEVDTALGRVLVALVLQRLRAARVHQGVHAVR